LNDRVLNTAHGRVRFRESGSKGPVVLMTPDGPNVVEHHAKVIDLLAPHARVICFDMPGFGFSKQAWSYRHRLEQGAAVVVSAMDALDVREASLLFSCANGFYAIATAKAAPQRIRRLVLTQTPGISAMPAWTKANVPKLIQTPVAGQITMRLAKRKFAHAWYGIAMNDKAQKAEFRSIADAALKRGACFCLADVVQGLGRATAEQLAGVKQPTTLLWGDSDRSHKGTRAESLQELIPHAQIRHCPDCGHFPDLEQPQAYAETVLNAIA
jgi:pimeloyl-ACP methyl ester carboxylesterase